MSQRSFKGLKKYEKSELRSEKILKWFYVRPSVFYEGMKDIHRSASSHFRKTWRIIIDLLAILRTDFLKAFQDLTYDVSRIF